MKTSKLLYLISSSLTSQVPGQRLSQISETGCKCLRSYSGITISRERRNKLLQCQFVHHESHMKTPESESKTPQLEASI
jgi:hypothetical protein